MSRNCKIDNLRCIGTALVILAHTSIPKLLSEIRTFDVIVLVLIAGISFSYSSEESYGKYLLKRTKRLLLPAYMCMGVIFSTVFVVCLVANKGQLFSLSTILNSLFFTDRGIGYIWIAKVYFIIALLSPVLKYTNRKVANDTIFVSILLCILIINGLLVRIEWLSEYIVYSDYLCYVLPYSAVYLIGIRFADCSTCFKKSVFLLSIVGFIVYIFINGFTPGQVKYPPDYGYISYGLTCGCILLWIIPSKRIKICEYISRNSYAIYLIHIIILYGYNFMCDIIKLKIMNFWFIQYTFILLLSIGVNELLNQVKIMKARN